MLTPLGLFHQPIQGLAKTTDLPDLFAPLDIGPFTQQSFELLTQICHLLVLTAVEEVHREEYIGADAMNTT